MPLTVQSACARVNPAANKLFFTYHSADMVQPEIRAAATPDTITRERLCIMLMPDL
jgi:hypothetical protein